MVIEGSILSVLHKTCEYFHIVISLIVLRKSKFSRALFVSRLYECGIKTFFSCPRLLKLFIFSD